MRGDGRLFKYKGSCYWWAAYEVKGREVRESTRERDDKKAARFLRKRVAEALRGDVIPEEARVTLGDLFEMLRLDYQVNERRSITTIPYHLRRLGEHFNDETKALAITTERIQQYVLARKREGAAGATINNELALLGRAFTLAIRARRLRVKPFIPKVEPDPSRVRQGFFSRDEVEALCSRLDADLADAVRFLFFSAWRVGEVRTLQWRDYNRTEQTIRLRPEHSKTKHPRVLPVEGELAAIIDRRVARRRLDCPYSTATAARWATFASRGKRRARQLAWKAGSSTISAGAAYAT